MAINIAVQTTQFNYPIFEWEVASASRKVVTAYLRHNTDFRPERVMKTAELLS